MHQRLIGTKTELNSKALFIDKNYSHYYRNRIESAMELKRFSRSVGLKWEQLAGCDWPIIRRFSDESSPKPSANTA